jgi:hypothetical protein
MPKILQEMIASISSAEPRFRIVARLSGESDLLRAIRQMRPEVVITQETAEGEDQIEEQVAIWESSVKVIAITEAGTTAALYRIGLQRKPLGEISARRLISVINDAVAVS